MRLPSTGRATPVGRQLPLIPSKPTTQCHVYQHASVPSDGRLMASGESDLQNYPGRANQSDSARACPSHGMGQSHGTLAWLRPVQISLYEYKRASSKEREMRLLRHPLVISQRGKPCWSQYKTDSIPGQISVNRDVESPEPFDSGLLRA